jgi:hypothetical protein
MGVRNVNVCRSGTERQELTLAQSYDSSIAQLRMSVVKLNVE